MPHCGGPVSIRVIELETRFVPESEALETAMDYVVPPPLALISRGIKIMPKSDTLRTAVHICVMHRMFAESTDGEILPTAKSGQDSPRTCPRKSGNSRYENAELELV